MATLRSEVSNVRIFNEIVRCLITVSDYDDTFQLHGNLKGFHGRKPHTSVDE